MKLLVLRLRGSKAVVNIGDTSQFIRLEKEYQRTLGNSTGLRACM